MKGISIIQAIEFILSIPKDDIIPDSHAKLRCKQRNISKDWVKECIIDKIIVGILKQNEYKFKLYYEHPGKSNKDLIIVIVINSFSNIILVETVFEQDKKRRAR